MREGDLIRGASGALSRKAEGDPRGPFQERDVRGRGRATAAAAIAAEVASEADCEAPRMAVEGANEARPPRSRA